MACIPGGEFLRGADDGPRKARPAARVFVRSFLMDRNEVTVAEYQACVRSGRCPKAGPIYVDFDHPRQPITGVSWFDADTFCRVQGKRLPTDRKSVV